MPTYQAQGLRELLVWLVLALPLAQIDQKTCSGNVIGKNSQTSRQIKNRKNAFGETHSG